MLEFLKKQINNKRIVILGFGLEGQSSLKYLAANGFLQQIIVADQNPDLAKHPLVQEYDLEVITGTEYLQKLSNNDFIIKSPGVPLVKNRPDLTSHSQTSLFLENYGSQIIGITGTKGKSTTSTMIFRILEEQNKECILVGNIGQPAFDLIHKISSKSIIVYELSAHQLQCVEMGPKMALLLNLMPEHLDYFKDENDYYEAKLNIFKNQAPPFFRFISEQTFKKYPSSFFSSIKKETEIIKDEIVFENQTLIRLKELKYLLGRHHLENIQGVLELVIFLELDIPKACESLKNFHPLPHRQEFLGEKKGVRFINDSISTIPQSAIHAINAIGELDYLILGGLDRGIDYTSLAEYLGNQSFKKVYFLGKAGKSILKELRENEIFMHFQFQWNEKLQDIREELLQIQTGTVLLSPAAASYDAFKNFEERGDYFREIFNDLK